MWPEAHALLRGLRADLSASLPGPRAQARMAPRPLEGPPREEEVRPDARRGAVLALIYPHRDRLWMPFILRPTYNGVHSGQIGFPGGGQEPDDRDLVATALRESYEEVGVVSGSVQVLGRLSTLYIPPSNYLVQPVLGYLPNRPHFRLDPYEVAGLIEVDLLALLDPANLREEARRLRDRRLADVPYFAVDDHVIWGATAMMLGELTALPAMHAYAQALNSSRCLT